MESELIEIGKRLAEESATILLLILGVKWLVRDRDKVVSVLQEERDERIKGLEARAEQCETHRAQLQENQQKLEDEFRSLLMRMARMGHGREETILGGGEED